MKFSDFKEDVRTQADILAMCGTLGIEVQRRGKVWVGLCPFHSEKTGSFTIYADQGRFHCFGCGADGDVFDLIQKRTGGDFKDAVEFAARAAGVAIPDWTPSEPGEKATRGAAEAILRTAATYWQAQLIQNAKAEAHRDYLRSRGFGEDAWKMWGAGAAGNQNGLVAHLKAENHDLALAARIGVIKDAGQGKYRDFFRDRIVIPFWRGGKVAYATGRAISSENEPKYLHLPGGEFVKKTIYGQSRERALIVVEGAFDVWAVEAIAPPGVGAVAIMGLGLNDPTLAKALNGREIVYVGLDDDAAGQGHVEALAALAGWERTRIVRWGAHKDAAEYFRATHGNDFETILDQAPTALAWLLARIEAATDKVAAVEAASKIAANLSIGGRDLLVNGLKRAAKGTLTPKAINAMVAAAMPEQPKVDAGLPYYYTMDGEMWRDHGRAARKIASGGVVTFEEMIRVDDGVESDLILGLKVQLADGTTRNERIAAEDSGDPAVMIKHIRRVAGPRLSILAGERAHITQAIDALSAGLPERTEVARTGWVAGEAGTLAYATPGGLVGQLPDGWRVQMPGDLGELGRFAVKDDGHGAFVYAIDGVFAGLLEAFDPAVSYPMLAFALMPMAARWMNAQKFVLHMSGETGSLKTETCKILQSFYGNFRSSAAITSWRSTVNSIEQIGWWLPDVLMLVDDYKPSIVPSWDFTELIQRYADGNARTRLDRQSKMRKRQAMRCWLLSNGEDIPTGESSVLARMITIRLPKRPRGAAYNAPLSKAQRLAEYFPTFSARWAAWLMERDGKVGFAARIELYHQQLADLIQSSAPETPNVNRIARNIAMLRAIWDVIGEWGTEKFPEEWKEIVVDAWDRVPGVMAKLALDVAGHVVEEKPTRVFLNLVQEGLDNGRFYLLPRGGQGSARTGLVGYYDKEGIYLLPSTYREAGKWQREAGNSLGFSNHELYRLLKQDGLIVQEGREGVAVSIRVGVVGSTRTVKAIWLKRGSLIAPDGVDDVDAL